MALLPHLHLLIPAHDASLQLEARLYLHPQPPSSTSTSSELKLPLSNAVSSVAIRIPELDPSVAESLGSWGVDRLITAAHPWGMLGGNMLDPVIADYLAGSALTHPKQTAVLSFNVRGVGQSTGSQSWHWLSQGQNAEDFREVERWGISVLGVKEVLRVGYSWGTMAALSAPLPSRSPSSPPSPSPHLSSILLISPPLTFFWALSFFTSDSLSKALRATLRDAISPKTHIRMIYGTNDEFTRAGSYRSFSREMGDLGLATREIEGAAHFYRSAEEGEQLIRAIKEWLDSV